MSSTAQLLRQTVVGGASAAKGTGAFLCGFCGTGRCGECVIEVPQQIFVPLSGAGVRGAEEQPEQVISHLLILSGCMHGASVWLASR